MHNFKFVYKKLKLPVKKLYKTKNIHTKINQYYIKKKITKFFSYKKSLFKSKKEQEKWKLSPILMENFSAVKTYN